MKLYCGRNRKGVWKASLDEDKLRRFENVFESEVETIHNDKVYMIHTYHGFDYNYDSKINPIFDVNRYVYQLFHSVSAAKKCDTWKNGNSWQRTSQKNIMLRRSLLLRMILGNRLFMATQ